MSNYVVVGNVRSRTMRVLWMLEELEQEYSVVKALPRTEEVRALNPSGKVPVLLVDGEPISDSVAIMTYLADKHGDLVAKAGTMARARQDSFVQAVSDEIDAVIWTAARHSFILPEEHRVAGIKDSLRWEFARNQDVIAGRMDAEGPFVMGAELTFADILLSHCVGWAGVAKFDVTNTRLIAHNDMMRARPAFKRALAAGS